MQKTCNRDSYGLSSREEMFSYWSKKHVPILKKPVMISLLQEGSFKKRVSVTVKEQLMLILSGKTGLLAQLNYNKLAEHN